MIDLKDLTKAAEAVTGKDLSKLTDAASIATAVKSLDKDTISKLGITTSNATEVLNKIFKKDSAVMKIVNSLSADQKKQVEKIVKQLFSK